ncbi:MAG TPA: helix-turn-helix transcriptional regulator [Acholeplasma sp.]|mgnify:CR=1 FL=1|nr:helix-turn-helix transcriptional regulator [Acholeplasma sp.]
MKFVYPVINLKLTGQNIKQLRINNNMTVKDLQNILGFESPQAIYKWQWGDSLPTIDNLVVLAKIFSVQINDILVITETS